MEVNRTQHALLTRLWRSGLVIAVIVLAALGISQLQDATRTTAQPPVVSIKAGQDTDAETSKTTPAAADAADPESSPIAEQLVGVWHLEKHGERTLSIHADGTASVDVRLNMLGALMYGERLTLDLTWTLVGDVMTQTFDSGTPADAVKRLIRDWGDRREYRIVRLTDDELVTAEVDDADDVDVWKRIVPESESLPETADGQIEQSPR